MFIIIILIIAIVVILFAMMKYQNISTKSTPAYLSKEIEINEIYLSRAIQENFYNLNKERLTKEEFEYIINQQNEEQVKMFLNYIHDRYYGKDEINMKYIPFSTLIEDASNYSGYRLMNDRI